MDLETQTTTQTEQPQTVSVDVFHADWHGFDRFTAEEERIYELRFDGADADPLTLAEFSQLYDHVGSDTVEVGDMFDPVASDDAHDVLGHVYDTWNGDSFTPVSAAFIDAKVRSLSVGDLIQIPQGLFMVHRFGFEPVDLGLGSEADR